MMLYRAEQNNVDASLSLTRKARRCRARYALATLRASITSGDCMATLAGISKIATTPLDQHARTFYIGFDEDGLRAASLEKHII